MKIIKGEIQHSRFLVPYRVYCSTDKVIVCISGAKQTMAAWRSFVSHFISDYSVVVFDLPGQGRSSILSGSQGVTFDEQIDILHEVIRETGSDKPIHLAAASWGTIISVAYAAKYPSAIDKMILGSFGAKPSRAVLDVIKAGQKLFNENRYSEIAPLMIECFGKYVPESHKRQIIQQFENMTRDQLLSFYEHCEFIGQANDIEDFVDLKKITASTLIISGEYDTILDQEDVVMASNRIPDCEVKLVEGAGHFLHWEQAEILNTYSEFFAR